jgi:integrase
MGFIEKRKNGRYRARYRDPAKRERSKTFDRKTDAERFLSKQMADIARGDWRDPAAGRTTVKVWADRYEAAQTHLKASTRLRDRALMRSAVLPTFGNREIGSVRPSEVQAWISEVNDRYAPATVRKAHQLLAGLFAAAANDDAIPRSPCRGIKLPQQREHEKRFLTAGQIIDLADAHHPQYRAMILSAGFTGLRIGELAALELADLNLLKRTITVTKSLSEAGGRLQVTTPKTKAARRSVALPASLSGVLAEHISTYPSAEGIVFPAPEGGYLRRTNYRRRHWLPAVRNSVGEPCRFHDLRHSHVALLIAEGEHPKTIAARLGHTSVRTVLDVYGHLFDGIDRAAAERLDATIAHDLAASARPTT